MTRDAARAYVRQWAETGRLLEQQRWDELSSLGVERALRDSDALIAAALDVALPPVRRTWSGLVEQQGFFHRNRP